MDKKRETEPIVPEGTVDEVKSNVVKALEQAVLDGVVEANQKMRQTISSAIEQAVSEAREAHVVENAQKEAYHFSDATVETRPHAFVIMPFGRKKGIDGQILDFNAIYLDLIKPALIDAGFDPFRADEETVSGDILTDMFQELLLADLAICDMSIDNANVFYELGIRHAFRKRGVVHIQSGRAYMPFDIFNVRTIPYHTTQDGVPDPEYIEKDKQAIARVARDTWASDREAVHSPVFNLLTGLQEPDRTTLRTPLATGFWREYNDWKERVTIAQRQKRIGDILLLTEEISNPLIKEEAINEAGKALTDMGRRELALQQYRKGLEINPANLEFRQKEGFLLNRLGKVDEAILRLENLLVISPRDSETIGILGRIYKDMWHDSWKGITDPKQRLQEAFEAYHWLVKSFETYIKGFRVDLNQNYPGVNALTTGTILVYLADLYDDKDDPDPDIDAIRAVLPELIATLEFALETKVEEDISDYWTLVSLAELRVITAKNPKLVVRAYRKALTAARKNVTFLQSSLSQLETLKALEMRVDYVDEGINILTEEINRIRAQSAREVKVEVDKEAVQTKSDGQVFLFAGHMVDQPGTVERTFPEGMITEVQEQLVQALDKFKAQAGDMAFLSGASAGGEIIFIEQCIQREMQVKIHLPYAEPAYIKKFIVQSGDTWVDRYYLLRNHPDVEIFIQPEQVGPARSGVNPYERNIRWTLYASLLKGIDDVRLIALWDGKTSMANDLDGLMVSNMVAQMRQMGGRVEHVNTTKFAFWKLRRAQIDNALTKLIGESGSGTSFKRRGSS